VDRVTLHTQGPDAQACIARLAAWFPCYTSATVTTELLPGEDYGRGLLAPAIAAAAAHGALRSLKLQLRGPQQPYFCPLWPEHHPANSTVAPPAAALQGAAAYWQAASGALLAHGAGSVRRLQLELLLLPPPAALGCLSGLGQLSHLRLSAGVSTAICTQLLQALAALGSLQELHLEGPFSPAGLSAAPLAGRLPGLSCLQLLNSYPEAVPAAGLGAALAGRPKLRKLCLERLGAASLFPGLLQLPDLQHLSLQKCECRLAPRARAVRCSTSFCHRSLRAPPACLPARPQATCPTPATRC
jgi:hypothetical protein